MFKKNKKKILKSDKKEEKPTFKAVKHTEVASDIIKAGPDRKEGLSDKFINKLKEVSKPTIQEPVSDNCQCCEAGCTCCDHQSGTVGHRCLCRCHA